MPGYLLIEEKMLKPYRPQGFEPNPIRMGILDFMRELRQEVFPFTREQHKLRIVGLEEVLMAASPEPNLLGVSLYIRQILTSRANELEANMGWVQVIFRNPLKRANDFWFEPGARQRITLRPIFGSPVPLVNGNANECYQVGFNLT
jgi:hypothetical protein